MDFGFEKIMDFAMDIDNLNLANLVGNLMDKTMGMTNFDKMR